MTSQILAMIIATFSAVFAATAAIATLWIAKKTSRASEVTVFLELSSLYREEEVRHAMVDLSEYWRSCKALGQGVGENWSALDHGSDDFQKVNSGVRVLGSFF